MEGVQKVFLKVKTSSISVDVGDEPLQFKKKFPEITVAVCEDRIEGIKELNQHHEVIIMDDAYQHRAVRPGLSILLFDYKSLLSLQWFLPTGNLREPLSGRRRADVIVITKVPEGLNEVDRDRLIAKVDPFINQQVFFSSLEYSDLKMLFQADKQLSLESITPETRILLLTGIANPSPLIEYLKHYTSLISHHQYAAPALPNFFHEEDYPAAYLYGLR